MRVKETEEKRRFREKRGRNKRVFSARSLAGRRFLLLLLLGLLLALTLLSSLETKKTQPTAQVVEERRHWPKFGDALNESATDSITVRANEEIPFERARAARQTTEERKASDMKSVLQGTDKSAIVGSLKDLLYKRRMERQLAAARGLISGPEMPPTEDGEGGGGAGGPGLLPAAGAKGGYVPPSVRNRGAAGMSMGDSMHRRGDDNSVRVTNLSEDTREDDLRVREEEEKSSRVSHLFFCRVVSSGSKKKRKLKTHFLLSFLPPLPPPQNKHKQNSHATKQDLFSPFGQVSRVYIAVDRETGESRGFGFVNFVYRADGQRAIDKLDGYGYDSLILRVEWAAPRAERP